MFLIFKTRAINITKTNYVNLTSFYIKTDIREKWLHENNRWENLTWTSPCANSSQGRQNQTIF
jgi:hypothetical protein